MLRSVLLLNAPEWPVASAVRFRLDYLDAVGARVSGSLLRCWSERFEKVGPVRSFGSFPGQKHFPGLWWFATTGQHVAYESWLERDHVMRLDFDPQVIGLASQPFRLVWDGASHVPDFFARFSDGTAMLIDVRPDDRIKARDQEKFDATAEACAAVGWAYERVGELDATVKANLTWLADYRHPRNADPGIVAHLGRVLEFPLPLGEAIAEVDDWMRVAPTLFHLMWSGAVAVDLEADVLNRSSPVVWRSADVGLAAG